ncbi:hypothetical protein PFISCL1PPCAC_179, partial [Pristionchus fissidentatus]
RPSLLLLLAAIVAWASLPPPPPLPEPPIICEYAPAPPCPPGMPVEHCDITQTERDRHRDSKEAFASAEFVSHISVERVRTVIEDDVVIETVYYVKHIDVYKMSKGLNELPTLLTVHDNCTTKISLERGKEIYAAGQVNSNTLVLDSCLQSAILRSQLKGYRLASQTCDCDFRTAIALCESNFASIALIRDVFEVSRRGVPFQKHYAVSHWNILKGAYGRNFFRTPFDHKNCGNLEEGQEILFTGHVTGSSDCFVDIDRCMQVPPEFNATAAKQIDCSILTTTLNSAELE